MSGARYATIPRFALSTGSPGVDIDVVIHPDGRVERIDIVRDHLGRRTWVAEELIDWFRLMILGYVSNADRASAAKADSITTPLMDGAL